MQRHLVKLTNRVHETDAYVYAEFGTGTVLSERNRRRIWRKLCGRKDCSCGAGSLGAHYAQWREFRGEITQWPSGEVMVRILPR